ncbi:MAG: efflux RND transporter permease subunit [Spirochaetota bacterium]
MNLGKTLNDQKRLILSAVALLVVAGVLSWSGMPKQEDPSLPDRFGSVVVTFPGATAETVEQLVVLPMERELQGVAEIRFVSAAARADVAVFSIELNETIYETDAAWKRVEDAVARAERELPAEADSPETNWEGLDLQAVTIAITGSGNWLELRDAAEAVEDRLYRVPGVKRVVTTPELDTQVTVAMSESALRQFSLSSVDLAGLLSSRTRVIPGGHIEVGGLRVPVDTGSDIRTVEELAATQIPVSPGASLPLSALGDVSYGRREPLENLVRFNGRQAIIVGAVPKDSIDVVAFGEDVSALLPELEALVVPLRLEVMTFQPDRVEARLGGLQFSLYQGIFIVAMVLVFSMGLRLGLTVSVMIPSVALASLTLYASFGGVLQQMSVAALVMSLGLLVDNAIVVSERIQWWIDNGESQFEAANRSVREMAVPLAAATGTTLAAFLPLLLSRGATADFTSAIPRLVMLTIAVSFFFALTVTPTLGILVFRKKRNEKEHGMVKLALRISHIPARRPGLVVALASLAVGASFALTPFIGAQFFPSGDRNQLVLDVELPVGAHLLATNEIVSLLEREVAKREEVVQVAAFVGRSAPPFYYNIIAQSNAPHFGQLLVTTRTVEDVETLVEWSRSFAARELPGIIMIPRRLEQGPPVSAPVEIRLKSDNLVTLQEATLVTLEAVQRAPGAVDAYHDLSLGSLNLAYQIDDAAASRMRLGRVDVATTLLASTRGIGAGEIRREDQKVPVVVRSPMGEFTPVSQLESAGIWSPDGRIVPASAIGRTEAQLRPATIRRRDGVRTAGVYAQLAPGAAYNEVLAAVVPNLNLPEGAIFEIGGAAEGSGDASNAIARGAYVGIAVLLFILIAQFRSFRKVGIVLVTIPLSAVGIIPGLVISRQPFGFMSMLGVIALVGIVVNNAIILIDVIDSRLKEGAALTEAVRLAVEERTRPIILTALTTIAGLVPLLYSSSSLWPPFASALISGLAASTALTILAVPALYVLLFRRAVARRLGTASSTVMVLAALGTLSAGHLAVGPGAHAQEAITLEAILDQAPEAPAADAERAASRAAAQNATAAFREAFFPNLFATGSLTRRSQEITSSFDLSALGAGIQESTALPDWEGTVTAGVRQQLLNPGAQFGGLQAARAGEAARRYQSLGATEVAQLEAVSGALAVEDLEAGLAAAAAAEESLAAQFVRVESLLAAGRALNSDLLQLEVALLEVRRDIASLGRQLAIARRNLGRLLGREEALTPVIPELSTGQLKESAAAVSFDPQSRSDVLSLEATERQLALEAQSVAAGAAPDVSLSLQSVSTFNQGIEPENWFEGVVEFTWVPIASGVRDARRRQLTENRREVAARRREVALGAGLRFAQARAAFADAVDDISVQEVAVANQETVRDEVALQYEAGRRSVSDLLDAEAAVRQARTNLVSARLAALGALLSLQFHAGEELALPSAGDRGRQPAP